MFSVSGWRPAAASETNTASSRSSSPPCRRARRGLTRGAIAFCASLWSLVKGSRRVVHSRTAGSSGAGPSTTQSASGPTSIRAQIGSLRPVVRSPYTRAPMASLPPQSEAPYLDALLAYARRDPGRFHVPGHKGGLGSDPGLVEAIGEKALAFDVPA